MKYLTIDEMVTLPKSQYEVLTGIAQALCWAERDASKVKMPYSSEMYLVGAQNWDRMIALLGQITAEHVPAVEDATSENAA